MHHLLIHRGNDEARHVVLQEGRTVLGRDKSCDVILRAPRSAAKKTKDDAVSRKHAVITLGNDAFTIEDGDGAGKESHNGTFVNDKQVLFQHPLALHEGDVIRICDFYLTLCSGTPDTEDRSIPHDSSLYLTQPAEKLKLLLDITNRLSNTLALDSLLPQVVGVLMQIFRQADRGFLIMQDEESGALVIRAFQPRKPADSAQRGFSSSIVNECLHTKRGRLSNNVAIDFAGVDSAAGLALHSVICAPLVTHDGKAFGVLQLDCRDPRREFTADDRDLLMGVAVQASIALSNAQFHKDALAREAYKRDLELASEVVRTFLPERLPEIPDYEFFAWYESAREVGGDYYDLLAVSRQRQGILIGDVAGKGVPAALVMARLSAEARARLRHETDLSTAVGELNTLMQPLSFTGRFVTLAALLLDPATHSVTLANAGHLPPLLLRRDSAKVEEAAPRQTLGSLLGVVPDEIYQAHQFTLLPGHTVLLFTDGVTDAMNVEGKEFGWDRLCRLIVDHADLPPKLLGEQIQKAVKQHAAGCQQHDDITLLCFGRTA